MRTFELHSGDGAASAEMDRLKAENAKLTEHVAMLLRERAKWLPHQAVQNAIELEADNARLRALLLAIEHRGSADRCPFFECNVWPGERHEPECPAFDQSGNVR